MGAIVNVWYGPPSRRKPEGKAEVVEVLRHLGDGIYRARVHFLGDPEDCFYEREVSVEDVVEETQSERR